MAVGQTKLVQVTNIAPQATKDQMHVLFGYLGKIEDIRLYPTVRDVSIPVQSRICYIKFTDPTVVGIAQHMTNTVFIDRALIVIPVQSGEIPDEYYALEMTRNGTIVPGLSVNEPKLPQHVVNSVHGSGADQVILTTDSTLDTHNLPNYPPLPATYDSAKVEETRRTVLVLNIDSSVTNEEWTECFMKAGEVKYLRTCTRTSDKSNHLLVEFTDQASIIKALQMDGMEFRGHLLQIQHATQPINKPQAKSNEAAQREIEEAMTRFKEAQNMINASIEPVIGMLTKDKKSSRRSQSRSRSRGRRRRSRSRSRKRSRSRRRSHSRRRSRSRKRSRSRRRRTRSRSKRRSGSRTSRRKSRSKSRKRSRSIDKKSREKKSRERSKGRKSRDSSKDRKKSKDREKSKERDKSKERGKTHADSKAKEKLRETKDKNHKSESVDIEKKRSKSRSCSRKRSKSRDKRRDKHRSRSRGIRRRTPSLPRSARRRTRSRSKDRDIKRKDKDRKDKKRTRSRSRSRDRDKDRKRTSRAKSRGKSRDRSRDKSRSRSKVPKSRAGSEKPAKEIKLDNTEENEKDSGERSDNMDISNSP